jgi:hypothetical protein
MFVEIRRMDSVYPTLCGWCCKENPVARYIIVRAKMRLQFCCKQHVYLYERERHLVALATKAYLETTHAAL